VNYLISAFKATDDLELCLAYKKGHLKVLEDYGITNVSSNNEDWFFDDQVYPLVVKDLDSNEVLGGARLHVYNGFNIMPIQEAIGYLDAKIEDILKAELPHKTGEACGLWNAKKAWGLGLGALLTTAIVAYSSRSGLKSVFALSAKYTKDMIMARGFEVVHEVGDNGDFIYPIESHRATVLKYPNLADPSRANDYEKSRILSLVDQPNQTFNEQINGRILSVSYNL